MDREAPAEEKLSAARRHLKKLQNLEDSTEQKGKRGVISENTTGRGQALQSSYTGIDANDHSPVENGGGTKLVDQPVAETTRLFLSPTKRSDKDLFPLVTVIPSFNEFSLRLSKNGVQNVSDSVKSALCMGCF